MTARGSNQEPEGTTWDTASLRLGLEGMDLRKPTDPPSLADLINARFLDERTIRRRDGHLGTQLQDQSSFPALGSIGVGDWVYGHGNRVTGPLAYTDENAHMPIAAQGRAVFDFDGTQVCWTGDRLLVPQSEGPALGQSTYWWRDTSDTAPLARGIPAFLPLETDSYPASEVVGNYMDTCLSATYRFYLHTDDVGGIWAYVVDRTTGQLLSRTEISGASSDPRECRVFLSGSTPVALWRDAATTSVYMSSYTGTAWGASSTISTDCLAYDIAITSTGFVLIYRTALGGLKVTRFSGATSQTAPFGAGTALTLTTNANGPVAIAPAADGSMGIAYVSTAGDVKVFRIDANAAVVSNYVQVAASNTAGYGLSIACRLLKDSSGFYEWVIHACNAAANGVVVVAVKLDPALVADHVSPATIRYNSTLASKSFTVGDEVFCWLRSTNAETHYLLGGVKNPQVAGYADREEATARQQNGGNYGLPGVAPDPKYSYGFTWIRPYNTGQPYTRVGSVRVGDLDFLPALSAVQYGSTMYLSGSAVKNYDGEQLADAGFQDYPIVASSTTDISGSLTPGTYQYRVYAVWYNQRGERFQSAALTYSKLTGTGEIILTINTLPSVTQDGVIFEVYRTESDGQAFYLEGTVSNTFTAATVTFNSTMSDANLIKQEGDPHAPAVGVTPTLESFGPLGCSILTVIGDRMWGAGGQVPAGQAQFSLLKTANTGVGFDDLAGTIDVTGEGGTITSLAGLNGAPVIFMADRVYGIGGSGPDNYGSGSYSAPQLTLAAGALNHAGTTLIQDGILYWGLEGPLLLADNFTVVNISSPVRPLTETLTPVGVRSDVALMEVVWYCGTEAVLFNYMGQKPRWARWTLPEVVGCSPDALMTSDGVMLVESADASGDNGAPFGFTFRTGDIRPEQLREGYLLIQRVGIVGSYEATHNLRMREFYNGSPLWEEETVWQPTNNTWLNAGSNLSGLTPAQIDAQLPRDRSGAYGTSKRTGRQNCHYLAVEVTDISATGPTFIPYELSFIVGQKPGLGRTPINTFSSTG